MKELLAIGSYASDKFFSHTTLYNLVDDCSLEEPADGYAKAQRGKQLRPHNEPARKHKNEDKLHEYHLSNETTVIVGHCVGDNLSSTIR